MFPPACYAHPKFFKYKNIPGRSWLAFWDDRKQVHSLLSVFSCDFTGGAASSSPPASLSLSGKGQEENARIQLFIQKTNIIEL